MATTYRGYDVRKGTTGYWIYKGDQQCSESAFASEDAACDEIDRWKREAARQSASS